MRVCISPLCGCRLPFMLAQRSYNYYNLMQITHRECVLVGTRRPDESTKRKMENPLFGCCIHFFFFLFIFLFASFVHSHLACWISSCTMRQQPVFSPFVSFPRYTFAFCAGKGQRERWNRASV